MINDIEKLKYLVKMIKANKRVSASSFESLELPDISQKLAQMLTQLPVEPDSYLCETTEVQSEVEHTIRNIYESTFAVTIEGTSLDVDRHLKYIEGSLHTPLPAPFYALDSNHTWMIYWLVNARVLLSGTEPEATLKVSASQKISSLILDDGAGGIKGGPHDLLGHVASTYAAVLALSLVKDYNLLQRIRGNLYSWFLTLKAPDGSFAMHADGERDTRSTYCVLVVAHLLNIATPELLENTESWILQCQTYEGGFAGVPYAEAHGGYTFCSMAGLYLLPGNGLKRARQQPLLQWLSQRQYSLEGGFCGRSNKLVDACYSFWIGASLTMMSTITDTPHLYDPEALRVYILNCCQDQNAGGLRDKPRKHLDFYHTNYTLCGLSLTEHVYTSPNADPLKFSTTEYREGSAYTLPVNPIFGTPIGYAEACREHFLIKN